MSGIVDDRRVKGVAKSIFTDSPPDQRCIESDFQSWGASNQQSARDGFDNSDAPLAQLCSASVLLNSSSSFCRIGGQAFVILRFDKLGSDIEAAQENVRAASNTRLMATKIFTMVLCV